VLGACILCTVVLWAALRELSVSLSVTLSSVPTGS